MIAVEPDVVVGDSNRDERADAVDAVEGLPSGDGRSREIAMDPLVAALRSVLIIGVA